METEKLSKLNCSITTVQVEGNEIHTDIFRFNDYRVATAINNLLCNVNNVEHQCYKDRKDKA